MPITNTELLKLFLELVVVNAQLDIIENGLETDEGGEHGLHG